MAAATVSPALCSAAPASSMRLTRRKPAGGSFVGGLSSYAGLKAHDGRVCALGLPACTAASFARVLSSLRPKATKKRSGGGGGGGALATTCNAAEEIFRIAAIMNGLVLVGVAVGFVLLRVEALVEESD